MDTTVNRDRVQTAIREEKLLSIVTYRYMAEERGYIDYVLGLYLEEIGRPELQDKLAYCIHELAGNAKKANTKRVYFSDRDMDIHNPGEYHIGMRSFKEDMIEDIDRLVRLQEEQGLYVKFQFKRSGKSLKIAVRNNSEMTREESDRIQQKIQLAREANNLPEILERSEDFTEGAGLGLVMTMMMLRNLGISTGNFQVISKNGETYAVLFLSIPDHPVRKTGELESLS
ncbi:hypothetical protein [Spirochaeta dissipatitropha]